MFYTGFFNIPQIIPYITWDTAQIFHQNLQALRSQWKECGAISILFAGQIQLCKQLKWGLPMSQKIYKVNTEYVGKYRYKNYMSTSIVRLDHIQIYIDILLFELFLEMGLELLEDLGAALSQLTFEKCLSNMTRGCWQLDWQSGIAWAGSNAALPLISDFRVLS